MAIKLLFHKDNYAHSKRTWLIKDAAHFAVDYFGLGAKDWRVEIYLVDKLEDGQTVGQHRYCGDRKSKIYVVTRERFVNETLTTLFHEFTHLKHVINGDIWYGPGGVDLWQSSIVLRDPKTFRDYWNRLDEIDARKHQKIMLRKYAMKRIKEFWRKLIRSVKKEYTDEQLDWHYNDRRPSYAEMQARRDNMSNPGDKDYDL